MIWLHCWSVRTSNRTVEFAQPQNLGPCSAWIASSGCLVVTRGHVPLTVNRLEIPKLGAELKRVQSPRNRTILLLTPGHLHGGVKTRLETFDAWATTVSEHHPNTPGQVFLCAQRSKRTSWSPGGPGKQGLRNTSDCGRTLPKPSLCNFETCDLRKSVEHESPQVVVRWWQKFITHWPWTTWEFQSWEQSSKWAIHQRWTTMERYFPPGMGIRSPSKTGTSVSVLVSVPIPKLVKIPTISTPVKVPKSVLLPKLVKVPILVLHQSTESLIACIFADFHHFHQQCWWMMCWNGEKWCWFNAKPTWKILEIHIQQVAKLVKVPVPVKEPVIGTFTGTGTFTNFGILVVPVPDSQNLSTFRYSVPVFLQPEYRSQYRYWYRRYRFISVPDTGF